MKTYIIEYGIYFRNGHIEYAKIKVKKCHSDMQAKVKLEKYLRRKYENFDRLVIYKCDEDLFSSIFPHWT